MVLAPRTRDTPADYHGGAYTWDRWAESTGLPIHRGFYIYEPRSLELGWWPERGCDTAFVQLLGQEGVCESRITEIPPGKSLPPFRMALDELVYVLDGRGAATVWADGQERHQTAFEWQSRCLFLLPRNCWHQLHNVHGSQPVRLLHYNYLPLAMSVVSDPGFFFKNPYQNPDVLTVDDTLYAPASEVESDTTSGKRVRASHFWVGNFFPDLTTWDRFISNSQRGAGGNVVFMHFPGSEMSTHMSTFAPRTYKKAHRHGPGRVIVIPRGEGFSVLWEEGQEKIYAPWKEGSMLTPPNRWFHQHFNTGSEPARYLALHPPRQFSGHAEKVQDRLRDQVEYPDEDPGIRQTFESRLAQNGLTSLVPDEAYHDRDFAWSRTQGKGTTG